MTQPVMEGKQEGRGWLVCGVVTPSCPKCPSVQVSKRSKRLVTAVCFPQSAVVVAVVAVVAAAVGRLGHDFVETQRWPCQTHQALSRLSWVRIG